MEKLEKVELLREKTGVSYEDAKNALEACEYDTLDAIVYLEKLDKITVKKTAQFSTLEGQHSNAFNNAQNDYEKSCKKSKAKDVLSRIGDACARLVKKSCETTFEVKREEKQLIAVPSLVLILCIVFAFWVTLPLLVVGMFMDCKYRFIGVDQISVDLNQMCDKASNACENLKEELKASKEE